MGYTADMIVGQAKLPLGIAQKMLTGIEPQQFARQPRSGDTLVNTNHPAFVYGHLATYPAWLLKLMGRDPGAAAMPENYGELFSSAAICRDDPDGQIYPPMAEIVERFTTSHDVLVSQLSGMSDEQLRIENPMEGRLKQMLPTLDAAALFMVSSHIMLHVGQVSTWRRCFGLGSAM